jgi:hypothetical protein
MEWSCRHRGSPKTIVRIHIGDFRHILDFSPYTSLELPLDLIVVRLLKFFDLCLCYIPELPDNFYRRLVLRLRIIVAVDMPVVDPLSELLDFFPYSFGHCAQGLERIIRREIIAIRLQRGICMSRGCNFYVESYCDLPELQSAATGAQMRTKPCCGKVGTSINKSWTKQSVATTTSARGRARSALVLFSVSLKPAGIFPIRTRSCPSPTMSCMSIYGPS